MRILFLSHYFPPEVNAPANRTFEHCREWVRAGNEVHVVTCVPSHPAGKVFPGFKLRWYRSEEMEGIQVHRIWTYLAPNRGRIRRSLNYLSFVPAAVWRAVKLGRFDVIVATSPQFFNAVAGSLASIIKRTPWIFELRDLWPESIVAVGAVRQSFAVRLLERLELWMYRQASAVVCVTRSFIANLTRRGVPAEKLYFVPNGIVPEAWDRGDRVGLRERFEIPDGAFVTSYVGTIGMAHSIGTLLDAAGLLMRREKEFRILVVGDGAERERLQEIARARALDNVTFTGQLARDVISDVIAASDACAVLLRRTPLFTTVLPSKMFEAMAARRPVILAVEGEAARVLEASGGGIAITPEDPVQLVEAVVELAEMPDRCEEYGSSGQEFVRRKFSRARWGRRMLEVLEIVARGNGGTSR